ncbi:MAG: ferritin-like domain-containing protein, partial [Acidimicrobiales bacterium]
MPFDLDRYKRMCGRLDVDGIDFAQFESQPLRDADLRCVRYMHDVEHHTSCYLRDLLNTRAHRDAEISAFLTMWNFEELWHGEALGVV